MDGVSNDGIRRDHTPSDGSEPRKRDCGPEADSVRARTPKPPRHNLATPARFTPTWDTLEPSNLIDFMFDKPSRTGPNRPLVWIFSTERMDVPTVSDLWLQNGLARPLSMLRLSLFSSELRQSEGVRVDAKDLVYTHILPGEAVRVEVQDTLSMQRLPRALWFEMNMPSGKVEHFSAGPDRWQALLMVLFRA